MSLTISASPRTRPAGPIFRWREWAAATSPRRRGQIALGLVWLLDAALQYQPYMFTKGFVTDALASTAAGNPSVVAGPITWASNVMIHHIATYNAMFATIQLLIAVGIFWPRSVKWALAASLAWSVAVWWFGEGLGGVLTGDTNPFVGAPGMVILYALIAVLVWPSRHADEAGEAAPGTSVATTGPLGALIPKLLVLSMWASFVYFTLQPVNRNETSLGAMVLGMVDAEPGWVRSMDHTLGDAITGHGTWLAIVFSVGFAVAGLGVFIPRFTRLAVLVGVGLALAIWVLEDFGGIFTGRGTDPNSAILVLLMALFWPQAPGRAGVGRPGGAHGVRGR